MWEIMDGMKRENSEITETTLPGLENKIKDIQEEIKVQRKKNKATAIYK
jgi:hypothetical protein